MRAKDKKKVNKILGENSVGRLEKFHKNKDGWAFGKGKKINIYSVRLMEDFLEQYGETLLEKFGHPSIFMTQAGFVELVWTKKDLYYILTRFRDDVVEYLIEYKGWSDEFLGDVHETYNDIEDHVITEINEPKISSDTERLNWLISNSAFVSHSRDGEMCNVWFSYGPDDGDGAVPVEGYPQKCYHDAREAIDAAIHYTRGHGK